ncbi:hypothetical protein HKD24_02825 [Gluconobacter sp. LMG 31484]|uniref:Uncharacterized protein n=1 Tax=Gluconobacter vitians TaxID=2728102 RepID=A0ABR9Y330_9PROT|nr:hypothetical protein [Gluconobacter vitians]MBF0858145.1 hypothetical protein [Gluconobacter vitians]
MKQSDFPSKIVIPFAGNASNSFVRDIPQTTTDQTAASFDQGFPADTFTATVAGGTPPDGKDFNGILRSCASSRAFSGSIASDTCLSLMQPIRLLLVAIQTDALCRTQRRLASIGNPQQTQTPQRQAHLDHRGSGQAFIKRRLAR